MAFAEKGEPVAVGLGTASAPRRVTPTNPFLPFPPNEVEGSIPARFEAQVRRYPDRLAVSGPTRRLTYRELNQAANRVANALVQLKGHGQARVALLLEHDSAMVVAAMGALKSRTVFVP